jgi:hypothetical protein
MFEICRDMCYNNQRVSENMISENIQKAEKRKGLDIMEKKKGMPLLKAVIVILCVILIVISLASNILFAGGKVPHVFGTYFYRVSEYDEQNVGKVTAGALLLSKDSSNIDINEGDIVLCYPEGSDQLQLRSIYSIETDDESGQLKYYTATAIEQGTELSIPKENIAAVCTGYPQSAELGTMLNFLTGIKGIVAALILPCIVLVIFLIAKIASSKEDEDEDEDNEYGFYEYDDDGTADNHQHDKSGTPLFEPSQENQVNDELERKKMSIAENFSQKHVNPDSPYQKEKERTMQFKAQREYTQQFSRPKPSAESSFAARNMGGQYSTAPTADALREEMLRKTAEAERTGTFSTKTYSNDSRRYDSVPDNTGILSKAQLAELSEQSSMGNSPAFRTSVPPSQPISRPSVPVSTSSAPTVSRPAATPTRQSSSPNIDDILEKSANNERKKSVDDMSVDDLLRMIEDEKKKI